MGHKATSSGVLIKDGGISVDSGPLRARDVAFLLQSVDLHPTAKQLLAKLAENQHYQNSQLVQLAQMFDQMIDTMQSFASVAENMKDEAMQYKRKLGEVDSDDFDASSN